MAQPQLASIIDMMSAVRQYVKLIMPVPVAVFNLVLVSAFRLQQ